MNDNNQQEKWRELHGISEHERIWVSNLGRIKRASIETEDPSTFRKLTYIDGRPVYVDSLVLSVFGSDEDAKTQSEFNTKDINYKDGDLTNLSVDNLEWKKTYKRKLSGRQTKNDSQAERLASMTVTPEMIHNESYPILTAQTQDVSTILPASPDVSPIISDKSPDTSDKPVTLESLLWQLDQMQNMVKYMNSRLFDKNAVYQLAEEFTERMLDGGNLSNELSRHRGAAWVQFINVPKGHVIIKTIRPDGGFRYAIVRERAYNIALEVMVRIKAGDENWRDTLHPSPIIVTNPGYNADDFFKDVNNEIENEITEGTLKADEISVDDNASLSMTKSVLDEEENQTLLLKHDRDLAERANLPVTADEIISEIKKINADELRALNYKPGDVINTSGHYGKPVLITDMRNMREMYCPSIRAAADLLGVSYKQVVKCVWGKRRQIGPYQIRYKYWGDALHVMSGIYKEYMELIQKRADDIDNMEDKEFEKLSRELEEMENQYLKSGRDENEED